MAKVEFQRLDEELEKFWHLIESGKVKQFFVMYTVPTSKSKGKKDEAHFLQFSAGNIMSRRAFLLAALKDVLTQDASAEKSLILHEVLIKVLKASFIIDDTITKKEGEKYESRRK